MSKEYQVSVSVGGRFLFRTDWDVDKERVEKMAKLLVMRLPAEAQIRLCERDNKYTILASVQGVAK